MGFKEIEVGFPSASQTEFDFTRLLIEDGLHTGRRHHPGAHPGAGAPDQTDFRGDTGRAARHRPSLQLHLDPSAPRGLPQGRQGIIRLAVDGARIIREEAARLTGTEVFYEYSPESFTGTELDFAMDVFDAVADVWEPEASHKMILNLPATVEMSTPNVYADRIEWFSTNLKHGMR